MMMTMVMTMMVIILVIMINSDNDSNDDYTIYIHDYDCIVVNDDNVAADFVDNIMMIFLSESVT